MHRHFILHKPAGYLSQFVGEKAKQKRLGDLYEFPEGTMAIGRLDQTSEGLLLLTTDGKLSDTIRSRKVEKEYWVQVDGMISEEALEKLRMGVDIRPEKEVYRTLPCRVECLPAVPQLGPPGRKIRDDRHGPSSWISITITEGKFRQVRKMTAAVGFPTLRLVRVRIGNVHLADLPSAAVLEVSGFDEGFTRM